MFLILSLVINHTPSSKRHV